MVLPEIAELPEEVRVVSILVNQTDPLALQPVLVDRSLPFAIFEANTAVLQHNIKGPLYYSWYYDYNAEDAIPLPFYSLCGDSARCLFSVCTKPKPTDAVHQLLLVVSDSKLTNDPEGPLDFPTGAAFDAVQWQLTLQDVCPQPIEP